MIAIELIQDLKTFDRLFIACRAYLPTCTLILSTLSYLQFILANYMGPSRQRNSTTSPASTLAPSNFQLIIHPHSFNVTHHALPKVSFAAEVCQRKEAFQPRSFHIGTKADGGSTSLAGGRGIARSFHSLHVQPLLHDLHALVGARLPIHYSTTVPKGRVS